MGNRRNSSKLVLFNVILITQLKADTLPGVFFPYSSAERYVPQEKEKYMRAVGIILAVLGGIALIVTGINYANQTDKFNFLGLNVTVSQGNIAPLIVAGVVFLIGIIFTATARRA